MKKRPVRTSRLMDGERAGPAGEHVNNAILLSLSDSAYKVIQPYLQFVDLPQNLVLHEPAEKLKFAYFLNDGLASIVVVTRGGKDVEAGVIGFEGIVGTALVVGVNRSPLREVVQIGGNGFRIAGRELHPILKATPELQMRLSRYALLQGMQVAQTAACNRLHDVAQRLARWLLMAQDRLDDGALPITHQILATILGTDRPTVSLAAQALQERNIISYARGRMEILDRDKLESRACACYRVVEELNQELGLK